MQLPYKLLINAEAFGFGPTAAVADFFPYLRQNFHHLAYIGTGHTLDLQRSFAYDAIYDISEGKDLHFDDIAVNYDLFFTALDFKMAERAQKLNLPTVIYDPLTWYWPTIPPVACHHTLYIAQAFHGVQQRLSSENFTNALIVPPIVPKTVPSMLRSYILVNLGGIQNPYWSFETTLMYTKMIVHTIQSIFPDDPTLRIITSAKIASCLSDPRVYTYSRSEVLNLLPQVKWALMTPGLANIYDSAAYHIPTVFLPPANDSQGQQLHLIKSHQTVDQALDWFDLVPDVHLDYRQDQKVVLEKIKDLIHKVDPHKFRHVCQQAIHHISQVSSPKTSILIEQFGRGGAEKVAHATVNFIKSRRS